jgi:hypothetical protein
MGTATAARLPARGRGISGASGGVRAAAVLFGGPMEDLCRHNSLRPTVLFLEPNALSDCRVVVISICCRDCGQVFEFSVLNTLSDDKTEIRLLITEAQSGTRQ